jgi:hypothetical protein
MHVVFDATGREQHACGACMDDHHDNEGLRKATTEDPTPENVRAWIASSPKDATLGDGARHFGVDVMRFLQLRDS